MCSVQSEIQIQIKYGYMCNSFATLLIAEYRVFVRMYNFNYYNH